MSESEANIITLSNSILNTPLKVIPVIIHSTYGGRKFSQQVVDLYNQQTDRNNRFKRCKYLLNNMFLTDENREDPILVEIVKELKSLASDNPRSVFKVVEAVKDYYVVDEYDGLETLYFNDGVCVDIKKVVMDSNSTDQEKIDILQKCYKRQDDAWELFKSLSKK